MTIGQKQVGELFEGFMLIKEATRGVTTTGKPFLTLILRDATGEIEAKLWDVKKEDEALYVNEAIVGISGEVNQYRGKPQLRINRIRLSEPSDGVYVSDFIEKAPVDADDLRNELMSLIFDIENASLQRIVRAIIKKYEDELFIYPAAVRNHHEYASGLIHHTVSMLKLAQQISLLYPDINKDLLYAGVIVHDIGKVHELSGVVSTSYTTEGKLLGHITIMVDEIGKIAKELQIDGEEVMLLQHMVLSHHGKPEWGSPKVPLLREAELLHLIDLIDARMNMLNRTLAKTLPGEFTERIFALDNRAFYKPKNLS